MKFYNVSFKWSAEGNTYCSNIAKAEKIADVKAHYSKYVEVSITEATESDIREAEKKGKPIIECKPVVVELKQEFEAVSDYMNDSAIDCACSMFDYAESCYICDSFVEIADSNTDIYNSDLIKWLQEGDNAYKLEDVIDNDLYDPTSNYNLYNHIRTAQFNDNLEQYYSDSKDIIKLIAIKYIMKQTDTIGADLLLTIYSELDSIDENDTIGDIFEAVNNCLDTIDNE